MVASVKQFTGTKLQGYIYPKPNFLCSIELQSSRSSHYNSDINISNSPDVYLLLQQWRPKLMFNYGKENLVLYLKL